MNFVRSADRTPIVFFDLRIDQEGDDDTLLFGGGLMISFQPDKVTVDATTGRFYHPLLSAKPHPIGSDHLGLLSSTVAVQLAPYLSHGDAGEIILTWRGREHRLKIS